MKYDTQRPYAASYVIVKNEAGLVAFVMRSNTNWMNGFYGLPSGKTEVDESFVAAAVREAKEEIGIDVEEKDLVHAITCHRFSVEGDNKSMVWADVYFEVIKYTGQVINAEPHMHSELTWLDPNNLPENVIPSVAETIKAWSKGERYFEHGWK